MSTTAIEPQAELDGELTALQRMANALVVEDADSYSVAGIRLREVKTFAGKVGEVFDPLCEAAHAAHKAVTGQRKRFLDPAANAESTIKSKMSAWFTAEQRRKDKEAADERARLQREEEDRRLAQAESLEKQGRGAEAEKLIEAPIAAPVVYAAPVAPKQDGVRMVEQWDFEVVNADAIPRSYMTIDQVAIRRDVKRLKERAGQSIPGIKVTMKMVPSASAY